MFGWLKRRRRVEGLVEVDSWSAGNAVLIASSEQSITYGCIRRTLEDAKLIEAKSNLKRAMRFPVLTRAGIEYPDDLMDFQDYLDAYYYVPYVARAIDVKQFMIWQAGYDLEAADEASKRRVEEFLREVEADTVIRDGTLYALIFGNMYWRVDKKGDSVKLTPLDPMRVGIRLDSEKEHVERYVYTDRQNRTREYRPNEVIHLKFNAEPWSLFGVSTLRRVLPTVKQILFMEEKLPWIARRRADPLLEIQIGGPEMPVDRAKFNRIKSQIKNRKPGEDIYHDGILKIQEVYKGPGMGGTRQTIEPLLRHFQDNLVAGLGVPEPALGFGRTTTQATAEYQERILEAEVRAYQRAIKRMHENQLFKLIRTRSPVKLVWRPLKAEDVYQLSKKLMDEIEHGVVSPAYARQRLGYPDEAGRDAVIDQRLVPVGGDG
ncbi:phage portal protein [Candidatus Bathyarchaeota archaeon]|nr:phage portal protein [Candidatus Bathyarchaeota archaeon]